MKNPIQPLAKDAHGVQRFKENEIVRHLLDTHQTCSLNTLALINFSNEDWQQFAQLIGYSLSGYSELSFVDDEAYNEACYVAQGMDEQNARIAALEEKLTELRAARDALREPVARLLELHLDDLGA